ncbi:hypothetical protein BH10CHL1_BH10CHL1_49540 [soil metagenome]
MTFKFVSQPLAFGLYEPEGIYLSTPFAGRCPISQFWGEHPEYYAQFNYTGVALKGHIGLDFAMQKGTQIFAVDAGRVMEISYEPGGFGRYLKLEHTWGESLYANLDEIHVESGQMVQRGGWLGYSGDSDSSGLAQVVDQPIQPHLHLGIRIKPYNRFDGWGGFTDPLPYLSPVDFILPDEVELDERQAYTPPPMTIERSGMRRP